MHFQLVKTQEDMLTYPIGLHQPNRISVKAIFISWSNFSFIFKNFSIKILFFSNDIFSRTTLLFFVLGTLANDISSRSDLHLLELFSDNFVLDLVCIRRILKFEKRLLDLGKRDLWQLWFELWSLKFEQACFKWGPHSRTSAVIVSKLNFTSFGFGVKQSIFLQNRQSAF